MIDKDFDYKNCPGYWPTSEHNGHCAEDGVSCDDCYICPDYVGICLEDDDDGNRYFYFKGASEMIQQLHNEGVI